MDSVPFFRFLFVLSVIFWHMSVPLFVSAAEHHCHKNEGNNVMRCMTPLGAIIQGAIAGAVGTTAMDLALYARHRASGSDRFLSWEFGGKSDWKSVSAPAQVGRRLYEGLLQRPLADRWARLTNNLAHWGYGIGWGCTFGVVGGSLRRLPLAAGPTFGACVWASSYVILPLLGLYKPIWKYSFTELAPDLAAHLVYGTVTERTFSTLARRAVTSLVPL